MRHAAVRRLVCILVAALLAPGAPLGAQQQRQPTFLERWSEIPNAHPDKKSKARHARAKSQHNLPVSLPQALYLIRSSLLALNDANRAGNYTVLRDLAAPAFRAKNGAADLARIFADLRERHFDLFAVALLAPQLSSPPHVEHNGMLRLTGQFPTRPLRIHFDLLFQKVSGHWRLFEISVATPRAPAEKGPVAKRRRESGRKSDR